MSELLNDKKMYLILLLGCIIMVAIGMCPPFGEVTTMGMRLLGIFVGCIFIWLFGYITIGSIIGILFLALFVPGNTGNVIFPTVFGNYNLIMILFCLIFCYGLQVSGVLTYLAKLILSAKFVRKGPWHLAMAFWLAAILCASIVTNSLAAAILIFGIFYEVAAKIGIQKRSRYCVFVLIISATFCSLCIACFPYSPALWVPIGIMQSVTPEITTIPLVHICLVNWLLIFIAFFVAALLLKIMLIIGFITPEFSLSDDFVIVKKEDLKMTPTIKAGFFYIILVTVLMVSSSVIPQTNPIGAFISRFGIIGIFMLTTLLMCLIPIKGKHLMTFEEAMKNGVPWGMYFMLAAALTIASTLTNEAAGLSATITSFAATYLNGSNTYLFILALLAFTLLLTNCINNAVAQQLAIPIMTTLLVASNINPILIVGMATIVVEHGNILPSGSPVGALMHANTEWMSSAQVYIIATVGSICALIGISVCIPLCFVLV